MLQLRYFLIIGILMMGLVGATNYKDDPNNCPVEYNSVSCTGGDLQCGIDGVGPYCYDMSTLSAPVGSVSVNGNLDFGTFDGGYVLDCEDTDSGEPYCDNEGAFLCDKMDSCYDVGRQTTCTGGSFSTATCSASCRTDGNNHFACDGSTTDPDGCEIRVGQSCGAGTGSVDSGETCFDLNNGDCTRDSDYRDCDDDDSDANELTCNGVNGCEINPGTSCTVGSLTGTYAASCSGGAGVCIVDKTYFETGTLTEYQTNTTQHFLWGTDYGAVSDLIHFNNTNNGLWTLNASGCITWMDNSVTCTNPISSGDNSSWNESRGDEIHQPLENQRLSTTDNVTFENTTITDALRFNNIWTTNQRINFSDDGAGSLMMSLLDVGGNNFFSIATTGTFLEMYGNPGPANDYLMFSVAETQGSDTELNFYEGGTGHNRFWDSGSMRIGGAKGYLCSELTSDVDCDTPSSGADLVVQDDIWIGGKFYSNISDWSNVTITEAQISDLVHTSAGDGTGGWTNNSQNTSTNLNVNISGNLTSGKFDAYGNGLVIGQSPTIGSLDITNYAGAFIQANDDFGRMGTNTDHYLEIVTNSVVSANVTTNQEWTFTNNITVSDSVKYGEMCSTNWNGSCLNTICNSNLVMSIGCT